MTLIAIGLWFAYLGGTAVALDVVYRKEPEYQGHTSTLVAALVGLVGLTVLALGVHAQVAQPAATVTQVVEQTAQR